MYREQILAKKAEEIKSQIQVWAEGKGILSSFETISVQINICSSLSFSCCDVNKILEMETYDFFSTKNLQQCGFSSKHYRRILHKGLEMMCMGKGVHKMKEFSEMSEGDILKFQFFNPATLEIVRSIMSKAGLKLGSVYPK